MALLATRNRPCCMSHTFSLSPAPSLSHRGDVERLVDTFPGQSIDFFGALRARVYDDKVRDFISGTGIENLGKRLINSKQGAVSFERPQMNLDILMKYGKFLVDEQENVKRVQVGGGGTWPSWPGHLWCHGACGLALLLCDAWHVQLCVDARACDSEEPCCVAASSAGMCCIA
jgi:hypothetical protein